MSSLPRWMHVRLSVRFILMTLLLLVLIQTVGFWIVQGAVERMSEKTFNIPFLSRNGSGIN